MSVAVPAKITRYRVSDGVLAEQVVEEKVTLEIRPDGSGRKWLCFVTGPQSVCIEHGGMREQLLERGWMAQYGTKPVYVDGRWGGRNYDEIMLPPESIRMALEVLATQGDQA